MGAAEDYVVGLRRDERLYLHAHDALQPRKLRPRQLRHREALEPLHLHDELIRNRRDHGDVLRELRLRLVVEPSVERPRRRKHGHDTRLRLQGGGLDRRLESDERDIGMVRPKPVYRRRSGCVAGDYDHLAALAQKLLRVRLGKADYLFRRTVPVRTVLRVGVVDRPLLRTQRAERREDARPPDAGVEETNWTFVGHPEIALTSPWPRAPLAGGGPRACTSCGNSGSSAPSSSDGGG